MKAKVKIRTLFIFPTPRFFQRFSHQKRIELLRAIKNNPELGVSELAELPGRKQEAVSRDISFLKAWGIIETGYEKKKVLAKSVPSRVVIEI